MVGVTLPEGFFPSEIPASGKVRVHVEDCRGSDVRSGAVLGAVFICLSLLRTGQPDLKIRTNGFRIPSNGG